MEPFTLDRNYSKVNVIDEFLSIIWTERYYGNGEVELVVPATSDMLSKLPLGIFLGIPESDEIMILETIDIEGDQLKINGISILPWLNNRFIRTSAQHEDRYWTLGSDPGASPPTPPGKILWDIVYNMCCEGSPYLDGTIDIGITNPGLFVIPGLDLKEYDRSGKNIRIAVPYGPVYDALRELAVSYEIGMKITLEEDTGAEYTNSLKFSSYRGLDRTSNQSINHVVRFSPQTDSFADIKELQSIAALKTMAFAFAPGLSGLTTDAGMEYLRERQPSPGFDVRALQIFAEDITTDMIGGSQTTLVTLLNNRAHTGLMQNQAVQAVDGEIVSTAEFTYGIDYNLGDLIEVQGNTGMVQISRVTEYIRSQDASGEKAYPTVTMIN